MLAPCASKICTTLMLPSLQAMESRVFPSLSGSFRLMPRKARSPTDRTLLRLIASSSMASLGSSPPLSRAVRAASAAGNSLLHGSLKFPLLIEWYRSSLSHRGNWPCAVRHSSSALALLLHLDLFERVQGEG